MQKQTNKPANRQLNEQYFLQKIEELNQRISQQLEIQKSFAFRHNQKNPYASLYKKLPNIIVNNNTFSGEYSENDVQKALSWDKNTNQVQLANNNWQMDNGFYNQYNNGYDNYNYQDQFNYQNQYDNYGLYENQNQYDNYNDSYNPYNNFDPYNTRPYDNGYNNYGWDENAYNYNKNGDYDGQEYDEFGYPILDEVEEEEENNLEQLEIDPTIVNTWNIDLAIKNNMLNPNRVAKKGIKNKKLYSRLKLFYTKLVSLYEDSGIIDNSLYRRAKADITALNTISSDEDLRTILANAKQLLSSLSKADIQFINLLEYEIKKGALENVISYDVLNIIDKLIARYKDLLKYWDMYGAEEAIAKLYEIAGNFDEILPKVGILLKQRISSCHIAEEEKESYITRLDYGITNNDTEVIREVIDLTNKAIIKHYKVQS